MYEFVSTNSDKIIQEMTTEYEAIVGTTVQPASPEKVLIQWLASIEQPVLELINYAANQNIPSFATSANLDIISEQLYGVSRQTATAAVSTERFIISEPQTSVVSIPKGTRVTDQSSTLFWETTQDAQILIGDKHVDVPIRCQTTGTGGNGYVSGQINKLVDLFPYYSSCENLTTSDGGSEEATDEQLQEQDRNAMGKFTTAGAKNSYIYYAKQVSTEIADVIPNLAGPGNVNIYVLMKNGELASEEIKKAVLEACNADDVRPLTDMVTVADAKTVSYSIDFTYYTPSDSTKSIAEFEQEVKDAVQEYINWQCGSFGRDINPDDLRERVKHVGVKRIELRAPTFLKLEGARDYGIPELATIDTVNIINGGQEDE